MDAAEIIRRLGLVPHPEGGLYAETYRDRPAGGGRGAVTHIYYLLCAGEVSRWHRVDAAEVWAWHGGAPLRLQMAAGQEDRASVILGFDLGAGQRPSAVVPAGLWQSAESLGSWTLVGCTVAPAFTFAGFELAPPGWEPGARPPG
jgi:predicted cupin superfamily sugar epimerase